MALSADCADVSAAANPLDEVYVALAELRCDSLLYCALDGWVDVNLILDLRSRNVNCYRSAQ